MLPQLPPPSNRDVLDFLRRWGAHNVPGKPLLYITLHFQDVPTDITLSDGQIVTWLSPETVERVSAADSPLASPTEDDVPDHRHSRCADDIIDVLSKAGKPLTTTRIMSALSKAKKEWSQRYVEKLLAQMVRDGTLENPERASPRGYRLPGEVDA